MNCHDPRVRAPSGPVRRPRNRMGSRAGFSLVELIVAMLILAVGLLGLAAGTGFVVRSSELGRVETERAQARQSAVELLRARAAENFDQNLDTVEPIEIGRHAVTWIEIEATDNSRRFEITIVGPGRGARGAEGNVTTNFEYRVNRTGVGG